MTPTGSAARRRDLVPLLLLAALAVAPAPAHAQKSPVEIETIRFGLDQTARVGTWTPVRVDLSAPSGRFEGVLEVVAPDDDGTGVAYRLPVAVEAGRPTTVTAYVRPGTTGSEIVARVLNDRGRSVTRPARADDHAPGGKTPIDLEPLQTMIVAMGNPQGLAEVPALVASGSTTSSGNSSTELVIVRPDLPGGLPARWYGLEGAGTIVAETNDPAVREALRSRAEVIRQWVRQGGHLIVAGAARGAEVADALGDLMPAVPRGLTRLNDSSPLESFAGTTAAPLLRVGESMMVARLEETESRAGRVLIPSSETPLVIRSAYGFGRVTVIGVDVDQKPFATWKDRSLFWFRLLDLRAASKDPNHTAGGQPAAGGAFYQYNVNDLAAALHSRLDQPPGVTLVPFGWVAFFIFVYILLIGPGDYLFLKKVVKRMEWTWITFPLIVLTVSLVAYGAAYALKGTELKVVKVDVVDVDATAGLVRGRTWLTLFSPSNRDYDLTILPTPLDRPSDPKATIPAAEAAKAPAGFERLTSWFGPPTARLGGGGAGLDLGGRSYSYFPLDGVEGVAGVRVPIWSTKSFSARWSGPQTSPLVESELIPLGSDRLDGTIINRTGRPLVNAILIYGGIAYDQLGTIAPGASVRIDVSSRTRPLSGYLQERSGGFNPNEGRVGGPSPTPAGAHALSDLARTLMFRESMTSNTTVPASLALRDLDLSGQLALERPMLVADLDGPAALLALDADAPKPKLQQTTVLRVILPLNQQEAGGAP